MIPEREQERLRKLFVNAVHEHRQDNKDKPLDGQAEALQKKLRAIAPHQFKFDAAGIVLYDHSTCGSWCKLRPTHPNYDPTHIPGGNKKFLDQKLRATVIKIFEDYSTIELCSRLLIECSANVAESTNSLLWLQHLPKTFLRPRTSALAWNLTQIQKSKGAMEGGANVMKRVGLAPLKPAAQHSANTIDTRNMK